MNKVPLYSFLARIRPAPVSVLLKRLLGIGRRATASSEGTFWIDPVSNLGLCLLRQGMYEPAMTRTVKRYLPPGGAFVDVGANEGYFGVIAAKTVGPAGRVLLVEPQARLRPVLTENLRLNGITNFVVDESAISDTNGTNTFYLTPDLNTGASGLTRVTRYRLPTQAVRTTTLTDLFDKHCIDRADLMKIDIEGYEYEAVFGAANFFRARRVRALALEVHPPILRRRGHDPAMIHQFLTGCGYTTDPNATNLVYTATD
jgi:FkbM family methyltransferase